MLDMQVIVRLQNRGAQRLDHSAYLLLCAPARAKVNEVHPHNAAIRAVRRGLKGLRIPSDCRMVRQLPVGVEEAT